jgi:hypothetical protein
MLTDLSIVPPDGEPQLKSRRRIAKADEATFLTRLSPLFDAGRPSAPTRIDGQAINSIIHEKAPICIGHLGDSVGSHLANLLGNHVARPPLSLLAETVNRLVGPLVHGQIAILAVEAVNPCSPHP